MRPRVGSLFAGVEGFGQGLEQAGFEVAWQVEIDKDAVSVLERHYPNVRRYRDVREVKGADLEPVDVLVGGFPCQDLSVAGRRQGLAGERSGLFFEVARIAAETATPWLLLENVDGLLSQWTPVEAPPSGVAVGTEWEVEESSDLGLVLSTLQEHGYLGCLRVLDAQHFGVAQRRERVFIVGHLGATGERALEVLLESESVFWDLAACLASRKRAAGVPENGTGSGGVACDVADTLSVGANQTTGFVGDVVAHVPDVAYTLRHNTNGTGSSDNAWNTTYVPVSGTLTGELSHGATAQSAQNGLLIAGSDTTRYGKGPNSTLDDGALVVGPLVSGSTPNGHGTAGINSQAVAAGHIIAAPLTAGSNPNSNAPGRHREDDQNLVAAFDERSITSGANRTRCEPGLPSGTLHTDGLSVAIRTGHQGANGHGIAEDTAHTLDNGPVQAVAFNWQAGGGGNDDSFRGKSRQYIERAGDYAGALSATRVDAIAFTNRGEAVEGAHETLHAGSHGALPMVAQASVRRLMPVECERLMGWADRWTERRADGSLIPDGPRYRLCGNGVVAPVAAWIGRRLLAALEAV